MSWYWHEDDDDNEQEKSHTPQNCREEQWSLMHWTMYQLMTNKSSNLVMWLQCTVFYYVNNNNYCDYGVYKYSTLSRASMVALRTEYCVEGSKAVYYKCLMKAVKMV